MPCAAGGPGRRADTSRCVPVRWQWPEDGVHRSSGRVGGSSRQPWGCRLARCYLGRGSRREARKGGAGSCSPGTGDLHAQPGGFQSLAGGGGAVGRCAGIWHCFLCPQRLLGQMPCAFPALRQSLYECSALSRSHVSQAPEVGWLLRVMARMPSTKSTAWRVTCVYLHRQASNLPCRFSPLSSNQHSISEGRNVGCVCVLCLSFSFLYVRGYTSDASSVCASLSAWLLAFPRLLFLFVGNVTVKPNFVSLYCCPCLPVCFSGLYI